MKHFTVVLFFLFLSISSHSQALLQAKDYFTAQDSLRGSITPERAWWDLNFYDLKVTIKPEDKFISGSNTIKYTVLEAHQILQIDLQPPLQIEKVTQDGEELIVSSKINAHFITLKKEQKKGDKNEITVYYSGKPREAKNAPWDGGFSWKKDNNGKDFVATSCQGLGASVWWPNKDHMYDEVDSMAISVTVPKGLMDVSNGRLKSVQEHETTTTYNWYVANPINNYGVNVNVGDYVHFGEKYPGEKGTLDMDYYVLKDDLEKAKIHFEDAPKMMKAFEHWFGPYPFYEDSFKLVEVPYLGMEHQSSVTYGNQFMKGYLGRDLSDTGWGLKFDFIIIHEAGHEWFANNITYKDIADMWLHESFTAYSESLFIEYYYGKEAAEDYVIGTRKIIQNDRPIIGAYNVNNEGSSDMYYKGANLLNTIRQVLNDDKKWRSILRGLNKDFYHKTVTTAQIENYISEMAGIDFSTVFDQYLRTIEIPVLEYHYDGKKLKYRYTHVVNGFALPLKVSAGDKTLWIEPTTEWNTSKLKGDIAAFKVGRNFYIDVKKS
ncbi:M1 family metallopeptidase [Cellulophaga sp. L1A9]|uniref:M1 family metallopeptidase n=1 Tax=Cellulophaga sp. L1A9 TaxID=2686362 RepID=UPI00131A9040|nr:M1 family metallopeptidase [Cellulophaga sp. L1A9]